LREKIFSTAEEMKPAEMTADTCEIKLTSLNDSEPMEVFTCKTYIHDTNLTSSLYDIDLNSGKYKCAVASTREKYRPFGYYELSLPAGCKEFLKKDKISARENNKNIIDISENIYNQLFVQKRAIRDSVTNYTGSNYLNISDILLSSILTDTDIIDVQSTKSTNRVQLKEGYNSQITDPSAADISESAYIINHNTHNNSDVLSAKASTIADVYAKLSDLSMTYLFMLVSFFGTWALGRTVAMPLVNKIEKKQDYDKKIPYAATLLIGLTLFFPVGREDVTVVSDDGSSQEYSVMKSNYQIFERTGYYIFMNWATDATNVIVDSEIDSLISRAGLSNTDDIVHNYASKIQTVKQYNTHRNIVALCNQTYSNTLVSQLMRDKTNKYPTSELSFYADNIDNGNGATYYQPLDKKGIVKSYDDTANLEGVRYPKLLLTACGRSNSKLGILKNKYENFNSALEKSTTNLNNADSGKIRIVKNLIQFQYELVRDYGILGILGLPVTIMQTEHIGSLITTDNDVKDALGLSFIDNQVHSFLSALPLYLLPSVSTIYGISKDHAMILGAVGGANIATDITDSNWFNEILSAVTGAITGAAIGKFLPEVIAMSYSYQAAITLIAIAPIIVIFLVGFGRFIVMTSKILIYHLATIFLLPVLFAKHNIEAVSKFTMKILATMIELPVFVLSIWLAMTAHSLLLTLSSSFSKRIVLGMIENLEVSKASTFELMKIYFFDGLIQVGILFISVVITYKLIITTHTALFDLFNLESANAIDNIAESMAQENHKIKL